MKKILLGAIILMIIPLMVSASSIPYSWDVDGESLSVPGQSNSNETATINKGTTIVYLTLNNYNGGPLKPSCYGTGIGAEFHIILQGENVITADDIGIDMGIELGNTKLYFQGTGSLTINAPTPISNEDYQYGVVIHPTDLSEELDPSAIANAEAIHAKPKNVSEDQTIENDSTTDKEQSSESDSVTTDEKIKEGLLISDNHEDGKNEVTNTAEKQTNYWKTIIIILVIIIAICIGGIFLSKRHKEGNQQ